LPAPLNIRFPDNLPVSAKREEIMEAIAAHQVVIVCGETGSGKTTQLPKIALAMGRGKLNAPEGRGRLIGHTQPRRIAASSVAKRIAEELGTPLGEVVGYKVRFQDRLARDASVKLMTDGILLAETQSDPLLNAYDTIIIDEAHERSLNIDFLLGYLRQLLPRRPDLKVVVTSATIDAERFAQHFASARGPAPVIYVSGRTFPVEQRWHPFEETRDHDLNDAIADAVDELWRGNAPGDILVFLPGEREIREAADHLRRHLAHDVMTRNAEVLPLFARLSQQEQDRVFDGHTGRRIVLATNVAETSLTVPGIRYVIDTGTARVKRYSFRSKVEQLLVEPVSQAAANQRAGRCGRVANGICIRLYDEQDFAGRARFTDPEILRSSLAGVILRMKSLRLGVVEEFPFIDRPSGRAITDGYQLLNELGAVDDDNELTAMGAELARLPLDPRVGRMILEARERGALQEVLVIAAALSLQDVRDRPMELQAQADQQHAKFDDEKSEFSGYFRLWQWLEEARGGHGKEHKLSNRQYEQLLRQNFINVRRVREWRDVHSQLLTVVTEHKWRMNAQPAGYEQLHKSMLSGLLGNIGFKLEDDEAYLGARGIKFYRHPGAHLKKRPGPLDRLRGTGGDHAPVRPRHRQHRAAVGGGGAGHLLKKAVARSALGEEGGRGAGAGTRDALRPGDLQRSPRAFRAGRPAGRTRDLPAGRTGGGEWETRLPFLAANQKLVRQVEELEHKSRRQDVLVDQELIFAFYDQQVPKDVFGGATFEAWYRQASRGKPDLLKLTRDELMRHEAAGITTNAFPKTVKLGGVDCSATYLHEPGDPRDGITVSGAAVRAEPGRRGTRRVARARHAQGQDPGAAEEPAAEAALALRAAARIRRAAGGGALRARAPCQREPHRCLAEAGARGDQPGCQAHGLQAGHGAGPPVHELPRGGRTWPATGHGPQPRSAEGGTGGQGARCVPGAGGVEGRSGSPGCCALHLRGSAGWGGRAPALARRPPSQPPPEGGREMRYTAWSLRRAAGADGDPQGRHQPGRLSRADRQGRRGHDRGVRRTRGRRPARHRGGLRRLFALQLRDALKYLEKNLPDLQKMAVAFMPLGTLEELREQILEVALDRAFLLDPLPANAADFQRRLEEGRGRLTLIANEVARLAATILADHAAAARKIKDTRIQPEATADALQQLQRLVPKRFLAATPWPRLQHLPRYLKGIVLRLDKLRADPARDASRLAELKPQEQRYWRLVAERKGAVDERMEDFRWLLEELRVSFFAQELRTPQPVSVKRLDKVWSQLQS
jgi:ATP-dependent helicase HrpA